MQSLKLIECKDSVLDGKVLIPSPSVVLERKEKAKKKREEKENNKLKEKRLMNRITISGIVITAIWLCHLSSF